MKRIIHQIWFQGGENIPEKYHDNFQANVILNPSWDHHIWSDAELREHCKEFSQQALQAYEQCNHLHQKVDLGRYVLLWKHGGMSIDMDAKCIRSLDDFVKEVPKSTDVVLCKGADSAIYTFFNGTSLNNAHIYAPQKGSLFLKTLIEECCTRILETSQVKDLGRYRHIQYTTGPLCITDVYRALEKTLSIWVVDSDYFEPCGAGECKITDKTYIVHEYALSWVDDSDRMWTAVSRVFSHPVSVLFIALGIAFVLYAGYRRYGRSVFVLLASFVIHSLIVHWNENRHGVSFGKSYQASDIVHNIVPKPSERVNNTLETMINICILAMLVYALTLPREIGTRFMLLLSITLVARCIFISLTYLPKLNMKSCVKKPYEKYIGGGCHDKIFSGHVALLLLLLWTIYMGNQKPKWARTSFPIVAIIFSFIPIVTRNHYTIDVAVSWLWVTLLLTQQKRILSFFPRSTIV